MLHDGVHLPFRPRALLRLLITVEEGQQPFLLYPAYPEVDGFAVFAQPLSDVCFRDSLSVQFPSQGDHRDVQHVHERTHGLSDFYGNIATARHQQDATWAISGARLGVAPRKVR